MAKGASVERKQKLGTNLAMYQRWEMFQPFFSFVLYFCSSWLFLFVFCVMDFKCRVLITTCSEHVSF